MILVQVTFDPNPRGKFSYQCPACKLTIWQRKSGMEIEHCCPATIPDFGPGTELKGVLKELKVDDDGCGSCTSIRLYMNYIGVEGCQRERSRLAKQLELKAAKVGWNKHVGAVLNSLATGLVIRLNPFDLYGSLIDEACRRTTLRNNQQQ